MLGLPRLPARPLARRKRSVNTVVYALSERHGACHLHLAEGKWLTDRATWSADRPHPGERGHRMLAGSAHRLLLDAGHRGRTAAVGGARAATAAVGGARAATAAVGDEDAVAGHRLAAAQVHRPAAPTARPGRPKARHRAARDQRAPRRARPSCGGRGPGGRDRAGGIRTGRRGGVPAAAAGIRGQILLARFRAHRAGVRTDGPGPRGRHGSRPAAAAPARSRPPGTSRTRSGPGRALRGRSRPP
ncbi:hypothetical protein GCM10018793_20990 [Streptomyces sulfonofaciens]|uniref:Uncharacterized protein n=1 Tax=Streptomyces sulfonofaciens TaxID=68272 RepID=A0A919KWH5_9ACTN|nr:hypothetical protein GCM10018793_20990 [Streptomyces sulfonofaciens]